LVLSVDMEERHYFFINRWFTTCQAGTGVLRWSGR
jgi:hypothetical protein